MVSFSMDTIYSFHPHFKAEGPPSRALVLRAIPSDLSLGMLGKDGQETAAVR